MNKGGLVTEVSKRTGLSKAEVGRVIDATIETVRETVVEGDRVTLADFGTFERKHRNRRIARNLGGPTSRSSSRSGISLRSPREGVPAPGPGQQPRLSRDGAGPSRTAHHQVTSAANARPRPSRSSISNFTR